MSTTVRTLPIAELDGRSGPRVRGLEVRWEISPAAFLAAPGGPAAARLNGHAAGLSRTSVRWHVRTGADAPTASCELVVETRGGGGGGADVISLVPATAASVSIDPADDRGLHVDTSPTGLLSLTLRLDPDRLLYARTSVLGELLGLPGGVYDAPTMQVQDTDVPDGPK